MITERIYDVPKYLVSSQASIRTKAWGNNGTQIIISGIRDNGEHKRCQKF